MGFDSLPGEPGGGAGYAAGLYVYQRITGSTVFGKKIMMESQKSSGIDICPRNLNGL
jgi:hypothetical protein